ncbi:response regulator [Spirosoma koreense]
MISLTDGPIVYIDDDEDDQFLFERAVRELTFTNKIHFFGSGQQALDYLETTDEKPLLILCDFSMPRMSGLDLRRQINRSDYLRQKSIPFLFYTTAASPDQVRQAYETTIQGFHIKAQEFQEFKAQIHLIITYWQSCLHPNSF